MWTRIFLCNYASFAGFPLYLVMVQIFAPYCCPKHGQDVCIGMFMYVHLCMWHCSFAELGNLPENVLSTAEEISSMMTVPTKLPSSVDRSVQSHCRWVIRRDIIREPDACIYFAWNAIFFSSNSSSVAPCVIPKDKLTWLHHPLVEDLYVNHGLGKALIVIIGMSVKWKAFREQNVTEKRRVRHKCAWLVGTVHQTTEIHSSGSFCNLGLGFSVSVNVKHSWKCIGHFN